MSDSRFQDWNPLLKTLILLLILVFMMMLGVFLSLMVGYFGYHMDMQTLMQNLQNQDISAINLGFLRWSQVLTTSLLFIGTAFIWSALNNSSVKDYYHFSSIKPSSLIYIALFAFTLLGPLLSYLVDFGEDSMGLRSSTENIAIMEKLLQMPDFSGLMLNLFIIAFLPALSEELFFRGLIQKELTNLFKLPWLAILLSAAIFSLIHMESNLFLPRMLMGVLLGVMFYCSRSIWLSIIAHFVNNSTAVIASYLYQHGSSLVKTDPLKEEFNYQTWLVVLSLILFVLMIEFVYKRRRIKEDTFSKLFFPL